MGREENDLKGGRRLKTATKRRLWTGLLLLSLLVYLTGCGSGRAGTQASLEESQTPVIDQTPTPELAGENQSQSGQIISITLAEMEEMRDSGEPFLVSFVTINCPYCQDFHSMLAEYVEENPVTMYQVILDYEEATEAENRQKITSYFSEFNTVPGVFYVKDSEEYSYLDTYHLGVGREPFDAWVRENQILPE